MALVRCPDCGSEVSDAAPACVRCGRPAPFAQQAVVLPNAAPNRFVPRSLLALGAVGVLTAAVAYTFGKAADDGQVAGTAGAQPPVLDQPPPEPAPEPLDPTAEARRRVMASTTFAEAIAHARPLMDDTTDVESLRSRSARSMVAEDGAC